MKDMHPRVQGAMYADDLVLWRAEESIYVAKNRIQQALDVLYEWTKRWMFRLTADKTTASHPTVLVGQVSKMPSTFSKAAHSWKWPGESTGQNPGRTQKLYGSALQLGITAEFIYTPDLTI